MSNDTLGAFDIFEIDAPDELITLFAEDMQGLGFDCDDYDALAGYMPEHKDTVLPLALKYYQRAKAEKRDDTINYFLAFFEHKGLDDLVPMLVEDYISEEFFAATRHMVADCLYTIGSDKYMNEYLGAVKLSSLGSSRQRLISLVGKLKDESAIPTLVELVEDETVCSYALTALAGFEREELRSVFERFADSENPAWRRCARDGLARLDK